MPQDNLNLAPPDGDAAALEDAVQIHPLFRTPVRFGDSLLPEGSPVRVHVVSDSTLQQRAAAAAAALATKEQMHSTLRSCFGTFAAALGTITVISAVDWGHDFIDDGGASPIVAMLCGPFAVACGIVACLIPGAGRRAT